MYHQIHDAFPHVSCIIELLLECTDLHADCRPVSLSRSRSPFFLYVFRIRCVNCITLDLSPFVCIKLIECRVVLLCVELREVYGQQVQAFAYLVVGSGRRTTTTTIAEVR